jgi:hypothetical protein
MAPHDKPFAPVRHAGRCCACAGSLAKRYGRTFGALAVTRLHSMVVVEVVADYHGFLSGVTVLGLVGKAQFTGTSKLRSVAKPFRWTVGAFGNFQRSAGSRSVHPSWSRAVPCQCLGSVGSRRAFIALAPRSALHPDFGHRCGDLLALAERSLAFVRAAAKALEMTS